MISSCLFLRCSPTNAELDVVANVPMPERGSRVQWDRSLAALLSEVQVQSDLCVQVLMQR